MRVFVVCAMCNDYTSHTSGAATVSQSMFCVTRAAAARALSFCDAVTRNDADAERERVEVHSIKKHTHSLRSRASTPLLTAPRSHVSFIHYMRYVGLCTCVCAAWKLRQRVITPSR